MVRGPHHVPLINSKTNEWDMVSGSRTINWVARIFRDTYLRGGVGLIIFTFFINIP
jgi:hypothetical protein